MNSENKHEAVLWHCFMLVFGSFPSHKTGEGQGNIYLFSHRSSRRISAASPMVITRYRNATTL
jgi:hypothetical protein